MVFVKEIVGDPTWLKGAAQLLQNLEVSLFSEWHFRHSTIIVLPLFVLSNRNAHAA